MFLRKNTVHDSTENKSLMLKVKTLRTIEKYGQTAKFLEDIKLETGKYPASETAQIGHAHQYIISRVFQTRNSPSKSEKIVWWYGNVFAHAPHFWRDEMANNTVTSSTMPYLSDGNRFILVCAGTDGIYETDYVEKLHNDFSKASAAMIQDIDRQFGYDPTNGIVSRGDILITSENLGLTAQKQKSRWASNRRLP